MLQVVPTGLDATASLSNGAGERMRRGQVQLLFPIEVQVGGVGGWVLI